MTLVSLVNGSSTCHSDSRERDKIAALLPGLVPALSVVRLSDLSSFLVVLFYLRMSQNGGTGDDRGWFMLTHLSPQFQQLLLLVLGYFPRSKSHCFVKIRNKLSSRISLRSWRKNDRLAIAICLVHILLHYWSNTIK